MMRSMLRRLGLSDIWREVATPMRLGRIKVRFIGEDGSMGLKRGRVYLVLIFTMHGYIIVSWGDDNPNKICPYSSIETLCENWESI